MQSISAVEKFPSKLVETPTSQNDHETVSFTLGRRSVRTRGDTGGEPPAKRPKTAVEEPLKHVSTLLF